VNEKRFYVYILKSLSAKDKYYVGYTSDLSRRLEQHNNGSQVYSRRYTPWELITYICFPDQKTATEFEKYLKNSSGKAFLKKRLVPQF